MYTSRTRHDSTTLALCFYLLYVYTNRFAIHKMSFVYVTHPRVEDEVLFSFFFYISFWICIEKVNLLCTAACKLKMTSTTRIIYAGRKRAWRASTPSKNCNCFMVIAKKDIARKLWWNFQIMRARRGRGDAGSPKNGTLLRVSIYEEKTRQIFSLNIERRNCMCQLSRSGCVSIYIFFK